MTDTGIGIPATAMGRIFDPFTQADSSIANRFGGTGLGLAICKGLARLLRGEVGVRSEAGQGSTFWFVGPVQAATGPATALPSLAGTTALVATTDPAGAGAITGCLAGLGVAVALRPLGAAGMAALWAGSPDCGEAGPAPTHLVLCAPLGCPPPDLVAPRCPGLDETLAFAVGGASSVLGAGAAGVLQGSGAGDSAGSASGDALGDATDAPPGATAAGLPPFGTRRRVAAVLSDGISAAEWQTLLALLAVQLVSGRPSAGPLPVLPAAVRHGRGLHVLVADDNRVNCRVAEKILERGGHAVRLVANGEEALDALEAGDIDLVLMDLNMPVLGGIEATKLYRFAALGQPHVPIIGLTADASPEAARRCREAGMDACLTKPIEPAQLIETVEAFGWRTAPPLAAAGSPAVDAPTAAALAATPGVASIAAHPRFRPALPPPLEPKTLASLEALGGTDFVAELIQDFLRESTELLDTLRTAADRDDRRQFRAAAHGLRSSAANMGARIVGELCGTAEAIGAAGFAEAAPRLVALLTAELDRVRDAGLTGRRQVRAGQVPLPRRDPPSSPSVQT